MDGVVVTGTNVARGKDDPVGSAFEARDTGSGGVWLLDEGYIDSVTQTVVDGSVVRRRASAEVYLKEANNRGGLRRVCWSRVNGKGERGRTGNGIRHWKV